MKIEQQKVAHANGWDKMKNHSFNVAPCNFVLASGSPAVLENITLYKNTRKNYPNGDAAIDSTSEKINDTLVNDNSIWLKEFCLENRKIKTAIVNPKNLLERVMYGTDTAITSFYSSGEISSSFNFMKCESHNQSMTITTLSER